MTQPQPTALGETDSSANRRIEALRKAAQDKHVRAVQRADAGIRQMILRMARLSPSVPSPALPE